MVKARHDDSLSLTGGIKQGEQMDERCVLEVESLDMPTWG